MNALPTIDTQCAQLAEATFDRGRYELQAARARTDVETAFAAQRSKGCRDRDGRPLTRPHTFLLCEKQNLDTAVFGRWLTMFRDMHAAHRSRCVRCGVPRETSGREQ